MVTQSCKMLQKHFILFLSGEKAAFNFTYNHCPVPRFDLHDFAKNLQDLYSIFSQNCLKVDAWNKCSYFPAIDQCEIV